MIKNKVAPISGEAQEESEELIDSQGESELTRYETALVLQFLTANDFDRSQGLSLEEFTEALKSKIAAQQQVRQNDNNNHHQNNNNKNNKNIISSSSTRVPLQLTPQEEQTLIIAKIGFLFQKLDVDNNGVLSLRELLKGRQLLLHENLALYLLPQRQAQNYLGVFEHPFPPYFILSMTIWQIGVFIYFACTRGHLTSTSPGTWTTVFAYRPDSKIELWRWYTYCWVHAGLAHVFPNLLIQLIFGIPLELAHSSWRIAVIYSLGAIAGSLGSSVIDPFTNLVGCSAADYTLIATWLADTLMNWREMPFRLPRLLILLGFVIFDLTYTLVRRYGSNENDSISIASHGSGFIAGLLFGIIFLRNLTVLSYEKALVRVSITFSVLGFLVCFFLNLFYF